jgi:hypothetical protein
MEAPGDDIPRVISREPSMRRKFREHLVTTMKKEQGMEQHTAYTPDIPWEELTEFPGEGEVKRLRDQGPGKGMTIVVRLNANGRITPHSHTAAVQHYILEGEYESEGKVYGAGTYRLLPGAADVAEISTQKGATILMVYDPLG